MNKLGLSEASILDTIELLDAAYESGVKLKQACIKDFNNYLRADYQPKNVVIMISGNYPPRKQGPSINARYQSWFNGVVSALSVPGIEKIHAGRFLNSDSLKNLDDVRSSEVIEAVFDNSLTSLETTIKDLRHHQAQSTKTVSLKKIETVLYIHVDPDDRVVALHRFNHGSPLISVFDYIFLHQGRVIVSGEVLVHGQGVSNKRTLSEDLRSMHINRTLKRHFFPISSPARVLFNNRKELSSDDLERLFSELKTDIKYGK